MERGWGEPALAGLASGNILRVMRGVERAVATAGTRVSARSAKSPPPPGADSPRGARR
jgi:hypothetical protein